jgi:hypothetical protein
VGFEPKISASERPQTYALDRAATGTGGLSPGGSGYFTCIQNMKLVITKYKSGGLHEKHVVATCNLGNRLSICL